MGLLGAISNAVSGLSVNQQNLNVLSQNISNANTPNYSNEVVNQTASFVDGVGAGVTIGEVTREVNQFLTSQVQSQTSVNSAATSIQSYYSQIESLLGQPGASNSIDQSIDSFFTAVQNQANSPSVSNETALVDSATATASQISGLASSLYTLQLQSDKDISSAVNSVNGDLTNLQTINAAIESGVANGQSTAGLQDQRDAALNDIAKYIDITPTYQTNGEVTLSTTSGVTLLSTSSVNQLSYTPASGTQTFISGQPLSPITVNQIGPDGNAVGTPVTLVTGGTAASVTTSLTGGSIQGLLTVRDSIIPNLLGQLDELASNLRDQVNAVNNSGTSSPPPNSYTGTRLLSGDSTSQYSGSVQIAVLDANGNPATSPYTDETNGVQPMTLNLATLGNNGAASVNDIITAINQYYGTPQNKTELGDINNVQLATVSNTVPDKNGDLQFAFNLNNISNNNANFYVTGVSIQDSTGATMSATTTSTLPSVSIASYQTFASNGNVTLNTTGTNTLTDGETVYLNGPVGAASVGGISASSLTGFFTVQDASGSSFEITPANVDASAVTAHTQSVTGATALPPYTSVASGQTLNTAADGTITANLSSNSTSPYYTVNATVATMGADGTMQTSTISYKVANTTADVAGDLIGATAATGNATVVAPTTVQPLLTATLVDANGNPLPKVNGSYGNESGYLKITAGNSSNTVAISSDDSEQMGLVQGNLVEPGTNQGFSQYFGLNNFFNVNSLTATGDTVQNSALNLSVASRITNNPSLISTATLTPSNQSTGSTSSNFTYQIASGDTTITQKLAALATGSIAFAATGGIPASNTTLSQYAGQIIAITSTNSTAATNTQTDSQTLLNGFTTRAQTVSGVNLDQELANTVIYQNAYTASTRVITVVSELFTELMGIIQ